jgi:Holliday junction resolvasome RuvABC endonuclease subunit
MAEPKILGLDLSLTATGITVVPVRWGLDWRKVHSSIVGHELSREASQRERYLRIDSIAMAALATAQRFRCRVAVIEEHAFSKGAGAGALERAELVGVTKRLLFVNGLEVFTYAASAARRTLGRAPQKEPKAWAHARLLEAGAPKGWSGDQLDAFLQANQHLSLTGGDALILPEAA